MQELDEFAISMRRVEASDSQTGRCRLPFNNGE